ncbi:MAG TPA: serine hydrolase domain-containing protein [Caulobacteraceae bacterium]|nr:serine hydrolase domain-containing protein [Caulobacteraceae bacterium]
MNTAVAVATPESVGLSSEGLGKIDAYLQGLVDNGVLAGVVTLVARHGKTVHTSVMGSKDIAAGESLALDTIFRIFSMTKPVTGVAMSICHDLGFWEPDDPVAKHLPAFEGVRVVDGVNADGGLKTVAAASPPTVRHLLTHTAGLSYGFDPNDPLDKAYQAAKVWESESLPEMAEKVAGLPLAYQPGTKWKYSMAMDVQGAMIERWTGQTLPEFYRTRIFEPLGMVDTAFHTPPEKRARLAKLYRFSPTQKKLVEAPSILGRDYETPPKLGNGGGGLVSTAADYARFAQMLLNGGELDGKRIVSAAALKTQMTNHLSDELLSGGYGVGLQQMRPGYGHGYDGAVFCDPEAAGVPVGKGTYQWDGAAGTWFWVDPVHDLLYVGLIQRFSEASEPLQKITQTMMADAYLD